MVRFMPSYESTPFIVTTPARQSIDKQRKVIRSYVMRGKNRKKPLSRPLSWISGGEVQDTVSTRETGAVSIPAKIGGEFSFSPLSAELRPDVLESIWEFKQTMFPIELGLASNQSESSWFEPILNDAACLHFTIYMAKGYLNHIHGQGENGTTALDHLVKALAILQQRLTSSDDELSTSDSTILVVVGLTMAATALGDYKTALKHISGLSRIVVLRGGISAFSENIHLQTKLLRADLGVVLSTGCSAVFLSNNISWDSYIASRRRKLVSVGKVPTGSPVSDLGLFIDSFDLRLRLVWDDLSEFVRASSIATQGKLNIDRELYREVMVSIHYRLVNLHFDIGSMNETVRLTLLAFSSTLFLQWPSVKIRYGYLAEHTHDALALLKHEHAATPIEFALWLYVIGVVFVFDEHEQICFRVALARVLSTMELRSWNDTRISLKSVLWVDVMHDAPAKKVVEAILHDLYIRHLVKDESKSLNVKHNTLKLQL